MEWIDVNNKLPEDEVLFTDGESVYLGYYGYLSKHEKEQGKGFIDTTTWSDDLGYQFFADNITHWMLTPKPPKQ